MRPGTAYRLKTPTLGTTESDGRQIVVTVPADALLTVVALNGETRVDVLWEDKEVTMFVADLESRGEMLEPAAVNSQQRNNIRIRGESQS